MHTPGAFLSLLLLVVGCQPSASSDAGSQPRTGSSSLGSVYYWRNSVLCRFSLDNHKEVTFQKVRREALLHSQIVVLADDRFAVVQPEYPNKVLVVNGSMEEQYSLKLPCKEIQAIAFGGGDQPCIAAVSSDGHLYAVSVMEGHMQVSFAVSVPEGADLTEAQSPFCSEKSLGLSAGQETWLFHRDDGSWRKHPWSQVQLCGDRVFVRRIGGNSRTLWMGSDFANLREVPVPPRAYSLLSWEARRDGMYIMYRRPRGSGIMPKKGYEWVLLRIGDNSLTAVPDVDTIDSVLAWLGPPAATDRATTKPAD